MHAVSFTYSGIVGVPIDRVFDLLSDATRMPDWFPGCVFVVPAPEIKGKGDRHRIQFERHGKRLECIIEIIEYDPPRNFGWVEVYRRRGAKTFFSLQFQGGSTKITMKHVWTPAGLRGWLLGQFYRRRNAHKMFDGLLQNVRKVLTR